MNGPHDLGGAMGFGPIGGSEAEPPFHAEWERRVFALTIAMGATGAWNLDMSRFAREKTPPVEYLSGPYYRIWLHALTTMLAERDLVAPDEVAAGRALHAGPAPARVLRPEAVAKALATGGPADRPIAAAARFGAGDRVRARNFHPDHHTRLPRYLRGHAGTIDRVHGSFVFPDTNASGAGEQPQFLYSVKFDGRAVWGPDAAPGLEVMADCWESYLEPLDG